MKGLILTTLSAFFFMMQTGSAFCQQLKFNNVSKEALKTWKGGIGSLAEDKRGHIWFSTFVDGFFQYDGSTFKSYKHDLTDKNSLSDNRISRLILDKDGIIWIATFTAGLNRFDPATNTFTHFRHNPNNPSSLINDSTLSVLQDYQGDIWVGTHRGIDHLNVKTKKFTHYTYSEKDTTSITNNDVFVLYEDKEKTLWAGCVSLTEIQTKGTDLEGGLNRFDRKTGKFTRYKHNPADNTTIGGNKVFAIFEDSKRNFWIGSSGDGLQTMDRATGKFTRYPYDSAHPENLSRPPKFSGGATAWNVVTSVTEDKSGAIWFGAVYEGISRYDPLSRKMTRYGNLWYNNIYHKDKTSGFTDSINNTPLSIIISSDGLMWMATNEGNLYNILEPDTSISYYKTNSAGNSFIEDKDGIVWIATDTGLIRRDRKNGSEKVFLNNPTDNNSPSGNNIASIRQDSQGNLWLAMFNGEGLNKYDPKKKYFCKIQA